ncbi:NTP transferase domain-containing protein [Aeromonas veronii]|uniref:NTP transferase domain-containing protein n=1 Tax=Aeromonas veronii TaxID=654 RepID=UPI003BA1327B
MKNNCKMEKKPFKSSTNIILLSAGSGSRMGSMTADIPKSLLPMGEKTVLDWTLDAITKKTDGEIVIVTGHQKTAVEKHVTERYPQRVKFAHNTRYADDVNILSLDLGVNALCMPETGYLIVETDVVLDEYAWDKIFDEIEQNHSFWVCKGRYHIGLTGGIVHVDENHQVLAVDYQPKYNSYYDGWAKMVGLLYVGPQQVSNDRLLRADAIAKSIKQYYLMPWHSKIEKLPCRCLDLGDCFAGTFNTETDFHSVVKEYFTNQSSKSC